MKYVSVDNPSAHLVEELGRICPNLQVVALDPIHLAMTWEYASSRKRTPGSKALRRVLAKLTATDASCTSDRWGRIFDGRSQPQLSFEENKARNQIQDRSMRTSLAEKLLEELDPEKPFWLKLEWIKALAALSAVYKQEVERISPGPNRKIYDLLFTAASGARTEWYFNNIRARHMVLRARLALLPIGTTSNEALHHEINTWFRETQKLHQSTLTLKLRILHLSKGLSHNGALYRPTCRQVPHSELLSRISTESLWDEPKWSAWCSELADDKRLSKAHLPLHDRRETERAAVKGAVRRKPAGKKHTLKRRRTPHTLKREDGLRRAGVKNLASALRCG